MKQEEGEEEPLQEEPLFLPSSQLTQQEIELVKHETAEMAEILQFDDDDLEEFAVPDRKNEDTEMEDVSEIAATQSDHSSGKVGFIFCGPRPLSMFDRHSVHCLKTKQRKSRIHWKLVKQSEEEERKYVQTNSQFTPCESVRSERVKGYIRDVINSVAAEGNKLTLRYGEGDPKDARVVNGRCREITPLLGLWERKGGNPPFP